ncbi:uncharacterized protein LOC135818907 [Sycon ciliatum]|uniref:uncharacterized protein LOC135818907 n=1 Tax=Sycon ciliatum TaxID=27933 RepID=UPI0031F66344
MKTFGAALICFCCLHTFTLSAKLDRDYRTRSDSDSNSASSESSSVDSDAGPCFLTQTCGTGNILESAQPTEFNLIRTALESITSEDDLVSTIGEILDQSNQGGTPPPDCFLSSVFPFPPSTIIRVNAQDALGFSIEFGQAPAGLGVLFSFIFTDLPSSFGELSYDLVIANTGTPSLVSATPRFRATNGGVFDLFLTGEVCSLSQPLVCGGEAPTDPTLPADLPTLPPAQAADLEAAMASVRGALCPP